MKIITTLISFRFKQAFRLIKSIGPIMILGLPMLFIIFLVLLQTIQGQKVWVTAPVFWFLLGSFHIQRKDDRFLTQMGIPKRILFLLEYNLLLIPFSIGLIWAFKNWEAPLWIHLGTIFISYLPIAKNSWKNKFWFNFDWIPIEAYEWRVGFRRYFPLVILYFIGVGLYSFPAGIPVIVMILIAIGTSFYENLEPKELLEASHFNGGIIKRKVLIHSLVVHAFFLPLYVLFIVFHSSLWAILLVLIIIVEATILFVLFYKYAHYLPRRRKVSNQTVVSLFLIGIIVPFFTPGSLYAIFHYGRKAAKRIQFFYAENK